MNLKKLFRRRKVDCLSDWSRRKISKIDIDRRKDGPFRSVILIPTKGIHDSGYQNMELALTSEGSIIRRGKKGEDGYDVVEFRGFRRVRIECMPGSKLMNVFTDEEMMANDEYYMSDQVFTPWDKK